MWIKTLKIDLKQLKFYFKYHLIGLENKISLSLNIKPESRDCHQKQLKIVRN